jgi:RNA polymerase sigma factor (sigma-70 family)
LDEDEVTRLIDVPQDSDVHLDDLYRRVYPQLVRLAGLLLGDFQLGEDMAQEAFARLVEAGPSVADPMPYLRGVVVNLCRSRIRRLAVARRLQPLVDRPSPVRLNDEAATDRLVVMSALRNLPRRQRQAAVLRLYGGLSEAETATVMGVSVGSVKTHLHRAVQSLSGLFEEGAQ